MEYDCKSIFEEKALRKFLSTLLLLHFIHSSFAQRKTQEQDDLIFTGGCVELPPKYPGGQPAMLRLISDSMRYPNVMEKLRIGGTVVIEYTVDTFGNTTNIKLHKGVCYDLDREALRLVALLKGWTPATQNGKKINSTRRQPFVFVPDNANNAGSKTFFRSSRRRK